MRDAGAQGREERRARIDRVLAGRSRTLIEPIFRVAAAIVVDALAFVIWNLAPRSPLRLLRDIAGSLRRPGTLARGVISFAVGLLLLVGAVSLLLPLLLPEHALVALAIWAALTGLLVEQIVGPGLVGRSGGPGRPTGPR